MPTNLCLDLNKFCNLKIKYTPANIKCYFTIKIIKDPTLAIQYNCLQNKFFFLAIFFLFFFYYFPSVIFIE